MIYYPVTLYIEDIPLEKMGKILLWCFQNLRCPNDFDYSDEFIEHNGAELCRPHYLYLAHESDYTALKLAIDI